MYFFGLVCISVLVFFSGVQTTENIKEDCARRCEKGYIPVFCTKNDSSNSTECVKDDREGMKHGQWDVDYKEGYRCILRCDDGYIESGCKVQRKWIEGMPTCVKDDWYRKMKDWGTTGLKITAVTGVTVGTGAGMVVATPALLSLLGLGTSGVVAGSVAVGIQTSTTAAGRLFAVGGTSTYIMSKLTGCEAE